MMQQRAAGLIGYVIEGADGEVGVITDILFDDSNWTLRWFVVNTGAWLIGRKVLIHPSELGQPYTKRRTFPSILTRDQVEASPGIGSDEPVSDQMHRRTSAYYGYSATDVGGGYGWDDFGLSPGMTFDGGSLQNLGRAPTGDPHLRSVAKLKGYHIHALDGDIGHIDDFLVEDESWKIVFAVVKTKNWGFGKHVLVSTSEIKTVSWDERNIRVDLTCRNIRSSPSWKQPDWPDSLSAEWVPDRGQVAK